MNVCPPMCCVVKYGYKHSHKYAIVHCDKVLYTNIDQTLVNSLLGLLNCEIGGLDCHVYFNSV